MVTGTSLRTSREALRLTRIYPGTLYSTAGSVTTTAAINICSCFSTNTNINEFYTGTVNV